MKDIVLFTCTCIYRKNNDNNIKSKVLDNKYRHQ